MDIGQKIKKLRSERNMTLKELSEASGLSVGFLSQLERGLTAVAIDTLEKIAGIFEVSLFTFFPPVISSDAAIMHSYERKLFQVENNQFIHYQLTHDTYGKAMFPRLVEILPGMEQVDICPYEHEGEEFIYVIEGVLTLLLEGTSYSLHPGDCAHYSSRQTHNWYNRTNRTVKILSINTPNFLEDGVHKDK